MTTVKRPLIIAEAGVNHNGSDVIAHRLIDAAAASGADIVKFQTFTPSLLVTKHASSANYQTRNIGHPKSQLEMLQGLTLSRNNYISLARHAENLGIEFLSTPFDRDSLRFLTEECGMRRIKISSGDLTYAPLLLAAALSGLQVIVSTGMSTLEEIRSMLGVLAFGYLQPNAKPSRQAFADSASSPEGIARLCEFVTLLHCTTQYPAPDDSLNLKAIITLREQTGLPIGFSDHSLDFEAAKLAVALGSVFIEKHFTLDRKQSGPDHKASLEPSELTQFVSAIHRATVMLGTGLKAASQAESENIPVARRSLVAARPIMSGQVINSADLAGKRPANGIPSIYFWDLIGTVANRDYAEDEPIDFSLLPAPTKTK